MINPEMPELLTSRIVKWNSEKGYGFVRVDSQDFFLHIKDFADRHKTPAVGDVIRFSQGTDLKGRPCARNAVYLNGGSFFDLWPETILFVLMVAPAWALYRLAVDPVIVIVSAIGISSVTYLLYSLDKTRARANEWRIPEATLQVLALCGGWPGAFIAQQRLRHKCSKPRFLVVFWMIVAAYQLVAIDFLLDWKISHAIYGFCSQRLGQYL